MPSEVLRELMGKGDPYVSELAKMHDDEIVDLPTGYRPQFTCPKDLASAIVTTIDRS